MIWSSTSEFWAMGGYGVYVWGSVGVSAALLALEVWLARAGHQQALVAVCDAACEAVCETAYQAVDAGNDVAAAPRSTHVAHLPSGVTP